MLVYFFFGMSMLTPGFEISGSTFTATTEDCPENTVFAPADFSAFPSFGFNSLIEGESEIELPKTFLSLDSSHEMEIPFKSIG